jgi:hypothetical protein
MTYVNVKEEAMRTEKVMNVAESTTIDRKT